jgi:uncharacterized radical SAM superfamily protein
MNVKIPMIKYTNSTKIIQNRLKFEYLFDIGYWDFIHQKTMDKF